MRVAIGRDYADVPPTRGVFKGDASSELLVAVEVRPTDSTPAPTVLGEPVWAVREMAAPPDPPAIASNRNRCSNRGRRVKGSKGRRIQGSENHRVDAIPYFALAMAASASGAMILYPS